MLLDAINQFFTHYWQEFLLIATAHLFAVMSPGPDFAIVMRQSLVYGRKFAIVTSIGIGLAILIHVSYTVLGISLIIKNTPWAFLGIKIVGALYLGYIGTQAIRAKPASKSEVTSKGELSGMTSLKAFSQGFLTNVFNPKATLFFLSLFTGIISVTTPIAIQVTYGLWMSFATACWFIFLSFILSSKKVRDFFANFGYWVDRVMGVFLILLALLLLFATID